ncbi:MAG TPA: 3-hydroxyacyl-CoA dehydrogenase family protein, partial [Chitinophagaceae bacterium]|nr:3-hydroxyacyl-CoA dehydrogenase family protein [Chitinophagaceae bacterium]
MQWVILTSEVLKEELLNNGMTGAVEMIWIKKPEEFPKHKEADVFIDLLFEFNEQRIDLLKSLSPKTIIVNSVVHTQKKIDAPFVRINAWPGFLGRTVIEASGLGTDFKIKTEKIFSFLNKRVEWIADEPGFITARIVSMIINEAYFALGEKVSTKDEIDTAMKLGTNYPFGPFEWSRKIGLKNISSLLNELCKMNSRYQPA